MTALSMHSSPTVKQKVPRHSVTSERSHQSGLLHAMAHFVRAAAAVTTMIEYTTVTLYAALLDTLCYADYKNTNADVLYSLKSCFIESTTTSY
jgi:hypothetical protein